MNCTFQLTYLWFFKMKPLKNICFALILSFLNLELTHLLYSFKQNITILKLFAKPDQLYRARSTVKHH